MAQIEFKRVRKQGEQKIVTIPKKSEIQVNDTVKIGVFDIIYDNVIMHILTRL
jgi:hypothetical protein